MLQKDALALLDEIRKIKRWIPSEWTKKFLESVDFDVRLGKQNLTKKQGDKLMEVYRQATDWECSRKQPENLQV